MHDLPRERARAFARAQLAELVWLDRDGRPAAAVVVPFQVEGGPLVALTYDRSALARELAASPRIALVTATALFLRGAAPAGVVGRPVLEEDPSGRWFREQLLEQELAKYPPARRLADSLLLQRENWWYLPCLIVRFDDAQVLEHLTAAGAVAAVAGPDGLAVADGELDDRGDDARLGGARLSDGPAVVLEHGGEVPELEVRWHRKLRGELVDGRLEVHERDEVPPRHGRHGLVSRLRQQRRLQRGCLAELRAAGHA
ncbi:MAG: pyridoxamine 5'-phosphate oxidase family protein [Actinomycetota bacterium]